MISILIPTYNYSVVKLVKQLHQQAIQENLVFEIIVLDDASTDDEIIKENLLIEKINFCRYQKLKKNIGRSNIRNLLSEKAQYNWLLFLDSDTEPTDSMFLKKYIEATHDKYKIVFGGIHYKEKYSENCNLRFRYGIKRESISLKERQKNPFQSFITMAFLIKKEVFKTVTFSDKLLQYGYEDTVFALQLKKNNFQILHINNTITHLNLDTNHEFIEKTKTSLNSLIRFNSANEIGNEDVKILKLSYSLKKIKILWLVILFYKLFRKGLINQLESKNPSLFCFDLFRLGYLCSLLQEKNA